MLGAHRERCLYVGDFGVVTPDDSVAEVSAYAVLCTTAGRRHAVSWS